jgi:beta-lactamase superfamily II metal-dependent hydrolase
MASARIHLLDIGTKPYGDCLVLRFDTGGDPISVIVDGGHSVDKDKLVEQFAAIFESDRPFEFDLMIISHGHLDHIGALPWLIERGDIVVKHALIPDPKMTFGPEADTDAAVPDAVMQAVAVLREEPVHGLLDSDALEEFAVDAMGTAERYDKMIDKLKHDGTKVVLFGNPNSAAAQASLLAKFASIGFQILGPSQEALDRSSELLFEAENDAISQGIALLDDGLDSAEAFNGLLDAESRAGNLVNAQSTVCLFELSTPQGPRRILLGGDYQFEDLDRNDDILEAERARLLEQIAAHAPYAFAKLSHHGSHNAAGDEFFSAIGDTKVVGICSGRTDDPDHPDAATIDILEARSDTTSWVRTDRSGHVKVSVTPTKTLVSPVSAKNITEPNTSDSVPAVVELLPGDVKPVVPQRSQVPPIGVSAQASWMDDSVRFEIPARASSMTIHFDLVPSAPGSTSAVETPDRGKFTPPQAVASRRPSSHATSAGAPVFQIGAGRELGQLLFLTDTARLSDNIGPNVVETIVKAVKDGGYDMCDVAKDGSAAPRSATEIREALGDHLADHFDRYPASQVVIVGGYDVIPAHQIDTIAPETPADTKVELRERDLDGFVVWSDDRYVDFDNEGLPDLPISRVPDGHDALFTLNVLQAAQAEVPIRQGIRNKFRPFVEPIFNSLPGTAPLLVSGPMDTSELTSNQLGAGFAYYMLHGRSDDGRVFYGETSPRVLVEALKLDLLPTEGIDIAVLGCCWGALTASTKAQDWVPGNRITGRLPDQSIALALLRAGARAVIGCTGAHYSPPESNPDAASGRFHRTLWQGLKSGKDPAQALFATKYDYADSVVTLTDPKALAIANKTLNQFTCLGLGC